MIIDEIRDNTCNGNCSKCGECCSLTVPVTEEEVDIIKQYVKTNNIKPINHIHSNYIDAKCCFYDPKNHKCNIYEVRPYVCKHFICSDKNWQLHRNQYEKRAKYNSTQNDKMILATFNDLIYNDYEMLLTYLINQIPNNLKQDPNALVRLLTLVNRLDLLQYMTIYDENNKPHSGLELLDNKEK